MQHDRLIYMANQIAAFFAASPTGGRGSEGGGAKGVADHINKYWEPRMRVKLIEKVERGEAGDLSPLVVDALPDIRRPARPLEERTSTQG